MKKAQDFLDWLETISKLIPAYLNELFYLVSSPKQCISERLSRNGSAMKNSLIFLILSILISSLLELPLHPDNSKLRFIDPITDPIIDTIIVIIGVTIYGVTLSYTWRIVGGKAEIQKVLTIFFYYSGVLKLFISILFLTIMGTIRTADPSLYKALLDAVYAGEFPKKFIVFNDERPFVSEQLLANFGFQLSLWILFAGCGAMLIWIIAGWGAYRELNQVSKFRSFMAGILFLIFCIPVTALTFVLLNTQTSL